MYGKPGEDAVNPFSVDRTDLHRLRGIEFVKNRRQPGLRQALQAQVAVVGDSADDETGLVDRSYDQAPGRAAADSDDDVAEVVRNWVEGGDFRANFFREHIFVAGNR